MPITKKRWDTATNCAPKKCEDCGANLEKPKAKGKMLMPKSKTFPGGLVDSHNTTWRVDCKCGVCYIWSFPNIYIKTHRTMELLMYKYPNGYLLKPNELLEFDSSNKLNFYIPYKLK